MADYIDRGVLLQRAWDAGVKCGYIKAVDVEELLSLPIAEGVTRVCRAKPTDVFMPDGTVRHFASEKEAARFRELDLLQRAGQITGLRCQVPFELIPWQERADGKWENPCTYIADFVYRDGCKVVVEDAKGYDDSKSTAYRLFIIKRKLMLMVHGIMIKEV